jgi:putative peptide zinc metalloprotease protein
VEEIQAQYDAAWGQAPARAAQLVEQVRAEQATLARLEDEVSRLTLVSGTAGTLLMGDATDLPGRFVKKGEVVGYLRTSDPPLVHVVVPQDSVDLVRRETRAVEVKLSQALDESWAATIQREVPAAGRELPSAALGKEGGGELVLDPRDPHGMQTMESLFTFELQLPGSVPYRYLGSRTHVRFEHPAEAVGFRMGRAIRRLFLSHFQL